jgi:PAS domain S-box-containing protein
VRYNDDHTIFPLESRMKTVTSGLDTWNSALVREMPCALVGVDDDDRVVLWNPAAERLLGYSRVEAVGRTWGDFVASNGNGDGRRLALRHRQGYEVCVLERPAPEIAASGGRAFFLEAASNLFDATALVIRDVLQLLPAFFSIIGPDLRYRMACRGCEILFGRPRREIEGQLVRDLLGAEAFAQMEPLLGQALAGRAAHGECRALGADGRVHFLRVHLQPMLPGPGAVDGVFGFAYDITELRQTEATLRDSESRLKFLIENNPDLVALVGRDFKLRFINHTEPDPATRVEELIGIDVIDLSPPEYRDCLREQYGLVLKTCKPIDVEAPIIWRGKTRWFSSRLVALPNGDEPAAEILVVSRETTQRIVVEQALRESEERFRQFAENLDDVVWIHDTVPERVIFVNEAFERVWGVPRQRLYDNPQTWLSIIHGDDRTRVAAAFQAVVEGRAAVFDVEYRIVRPDGGQRWIHDSGAAIHDDRGQSTRLTGIARDITVRKHAEDEKQSFQRQLLETQKLESLGVLAGGIAHDFNNLLAGILGNVNLAQLDPAAEGTIRAQLEQIETISIRAGELCKQMLAYAGKGRFVISLINLNALIEEISDLVNISISKKVSLQLHLTDRLPAVRGDASQLRQVLLNLVINASEAFGERVGSVRISTGQIVFSTDDLALFHFGGDLSPGPYVFLEVADNGPGMAPDVVERIFEPFFTTKFTGRGLGLAAVQGIVRSHGGAIRVTTKVGKGTVFTLLMPPSAEELSPADDAPSDTEPFQGKGEALIVDDEEIIRATLSLMLESMGFSPLTARDGREAIDVFERRHRDLRFVLLDLTMPVLSGDESYAELTRIDPSVPVIFMSGYMEQEIADRFHDHPIAGFLQKPFRMEALEQLIAEVVKDPAS